MDARSISWAAASLFVPILLGVGTVQGRGLSFEDRVKAQEAIERVYWAQRIWPKENAQPKPPIEEVMPEALIRAEVEDYLKKSNALADVWLRPITAAQLQVEMERMARQSRQPEVLEDLFAALGSDPFLIAECLVRPSLVDRLIRTAYARDVRFHGDLKKLAEADMARSLSANGLQQTRGLYSETTWILAEADGAGVERSRERASADATGRLEVLDPEEWDALLGKVSPSTIESKGVAELKKEVASAASQAGALDVTIKPDSLGASSARRRVPLPLSQLRLGPLEENEDSFSTTAVLAQTENSIRTATLTWAKRSFDAWWSERSRQTESGDVLSGPYFLVAPSTTVCTEDTWTPTDAGANLPMDRFSHTSLWTGSEMIVWGGWGHSGIGFRNTGGRYIPATDSWTPTSLGPNVPQERYKHTAVWTGTEMIVWGGRSGSPSYLNSGGRYNPTTDSWMPTGLAGNVPQPRSDHTAVWTGSEMVVWGGFGGDTSPPWLNTGGKYDPDTDTWTPTSIGPDPRQLHTAVWTGIEMIVWGGNNPSNVNTGARYNPSSDSWVATTTNGAPAVRSQHTAVWTGSEMIVWGGESTGSQPVNTGGRYSLSLNTWMPTSTGVDVAAPRANHTAVWTGSEMIVWGGGGGGSSSGSRYFPAGDTWFAMNTGPNVPTPRTQHTAVWTGGEMIVWGGRSSPVTYDTLNTGARYCAQPCASSLWYRDGDDDGFGNPAMTQVACHQPPLGYVSIGDDCDDSIPTIYPGAPQLCDGLDNDCNAPDWPTVPSSEVDADGDNYRFCSGECNDANPTIYPGAPQLCDGLNNDCNAPDWPTVPSSEVDADGDGFDPCGGDCNDGSPAVHPGVVDVCNGIDDNCNSMIDEDSFGLDTDGDGVRNACDNCLAAYNPSQLDTDHDGRGNSCDNCIATPNVNQSDTDADSVGNDCDNCPTEYNPTQEDTDADGAGDACDNCYAVRNPDQADTDHNGEGDLCDLNDGLIVITKVTKGRVEWQDETVFSGFNLYRGSLEYLLATGEYTQDPLLEPEAAHWCDLATSVQLDSRRPPAGRGNLYLVTGENISGEGSLGQRSDGSERPNHHPCP